MNVRREIGTWYTVGKKNRTGPEVKFVAGKTLLIFMATVKHHELLLVLIEDRREITIENLDGRWEI